MRIRFHPRASFKKLKRLRSMACQLKAADPKEESVLRRAVLKSAVEILKSPDSWKYISLDRDIDLRMIGVGVFRVRANSDDARHLHFQPNASIYSEINRCLKEGGVAVDVGANIGVVSVMMSHQVASSGTVISVEMISSTYSSLVKNIRKNNCENVTPKQFAISNKSGDTVTANVPTGRYGQSSIIRGIDEKNTLESVKTKTLDDLLKDVATIDLMKLDLEGAELDAFRGARQTLRKTKRVIFETGGKEESAEIEFLKELNFEIKQIDGNNAMATRR